MIAALFTSLWSRFGGLILKAVGIGVVVLTVLGYARKSGKDAVRREQLEDTVDAARTRIEVEDRNRDLSRDELRARLRQQGASRRG